MNPHTLDLDTVSGGVHASAPQPLSFAPSTAIRTFLIERDAGNLLLYSVDGLAAQTAAFEVLGGVARRYLNHSHEAMFASDGIAAPLFVHEADSAAVSGSVDVRGTFSRRHTLDDGFEVIPTPGHTPGATAYLWDDGERRFLFTGDSIYLDGEEWVAAVLDSSDRAEYLRSLELIRTLDFDVLVPWAASVDGPHHAVTNRVDARRRLDAIITRVRRGESR